MYTLCTGTKVLQTIMLTLYIYDIYAYMYMYTHTSLPPTTHPPPTHTLIYKYTSTSVPSLFWCCLFPHSEAHHCWWNPPDLVPLTTSPSAPCSDWHSDDDLVRQESSLSEVVEQYKKMNLVTINTTEPPLDRHMLFFTNKCSPWPCSCTSLKKLLVQW